MPLFAILCLCENIERKIVQANMLHWKSKTS